MKYAGLAGLLLAAIGWVLSPQVFAAAWLAMLMVWLGWPLGSLALLLVHRLTGGAWGDALAPALLTGVRALWLLVPAVAPLLLTLPLLYPWAHNAGVGAYLHLPAFALRGVLYLAAWLALGGLVLRGARRDAIGGALAGIGLLVLALTMTFAAIDLTMSLQPGYSSAAYGLVAIAGAVALAAAVAVLGSANAVPPALLPALGGLLLVATLLWGYLDFVQFLITAESDLPTDAPWYARRLAGGWLVVTIAISVLHLAVPVLTLLSRRLRASAAVLTALSGMLLVGAVLRGWWVVLPAVQRPVSWIDFACLLAFAGCSLALPAWPRRTPRHV